MDVKLMMNIQLRFFLKTYFLIFMTTQAFALESSQSRWNGFYAGVDFGGKIGQRGRISPSPFGFKRTVVKI
jgi:hypothetical protein